MSTRVEYMVAIIECDCGVSQRVKLDPSGSVEGKAEVVCKICGVVNTFYVSAEIEAFDEETYSWRNAPKPFER